MSFAASRSLILLACILSCTHLLDTTGTWASARMPVSTATREDEGSFHQAQVETRIIFAPRSVRASDGGFDLGYELHVASFQSEAIKLTGLTVFLDDASVPLMKVEGSAINSLLAQPARDGDPQDGLPIASGQSKTLFLWLKLPAGSKPRFLRHQLIFRTSTGSIQRADDIRTGIVESAPVRIAAPLRGGRWLAAEGPGNHLSHHWGGMVAIDGKLTNPQRFAVDWFAIDAEDRAFRGTHASPAATVDEDWFGYGREVLAVADGVVADVRDGIPNGKPLAPQESPEDLTNRTLYGNFVVLKIGPGVFAHYAHLKDGSLTVKIGQKVRRGTVIGRLGQTGAAGAPHLHFHISDRPSFERSEGLPFEFGSFTLLDRKRKIEDMLGPASPADRPSPLRTVHRLEMPLDGDVIAFP
jgi:murein DD-endopeptidase MepM/ murein hydrolase activator NlpD